MQFVAVHADIQPTTCRARPRWLVGAGAAERAGVDITTVQRMERHDGQVRGNAATVEKILGALEASGIEFINDDGRQGVVLRTPERESN